MRSSTKVFINNNKVLQNKIFKFFLSAGIGLLVDVMVYSITFTYLITNKGVKIWNYQTSAHEFSLFISYSCGVVANFSLSKYAVFAESTVASRKQFFRFAIIAGIGFFANYTLLRFFVEFCDVVPIFARILSALSLGFASYYIHKMFTFKV